jgi:hypothetical protein
MATQATFSSPLRPSLLQFQPVWISPDRAAPDGREGVIARSGSRPTGIRFAAATAGLPAPLHRPTTAPIFYFAWWTYIIRDLALNRPVEYFDHTGTKDPDQRTEISGLPRLRWFVRAPCWREPAVGILDRSGSQPSTPFSLDPYSVELAGPCPETDHG